MSSHLTENDFNIFLENIDAVVPAQEAASPSRQNGVPIPQKRYRKGAGRGSLDNQGLILFFCEDGSYFSVNAALREEYTGLIFRDAPALTEAGDTITIRFEWPGYPSEDFQLRTIDWCRLPNKIPQSKLATEVAKVIEKFLIKMEGVAIAPHEAQWMVGQNGIQVGDLRLAALEQVSSGSWQARLFYKPTH